MKHFILLLILSTYLLFSAVPSNISWQGVLSDDSGNLLDGTYDITIGLYDVESGGTALWTETQTLDIENGYVNIILGEVFALNLDFDEQYWLGIVVDGGENLSRVKLTSVPYSRHSYKSELSSTVKVPLEITYNGTGPIIKAINENENGKGISGEGKFAIYGLTDNNSGYGVYGKHSNTGNYGYLGGSEYGVFGISNEFYGVYGQYGLTNWGAIGGNSFGVKGYNKINNNYGEIATNGAAVDAGAFVGWAVRAYAFTGSSGGIMSEYPNNNKVELATPGYAVYGFSDDSIAIKGEYKSNAAHNSIGYLGLDVSGVYGITNYNNGTGGHFEHNNGGYADIGNVDNAVNAVSKEGHLGELGGINFGVRGRYSSFQNPGMLGLEDFAFKGSNSTSSNKVDIAGEELALYASNPNNNFQAELCSSNGAVFGDYNGTNSGYLGIDGYGVKGTGMIGGVFGKAGSSTPGVIGKGGPGLFGISSDENVTVEIAKNNLAIGAYYGINISAEICKENQIFRGNNYSSQSEIIIGNSDYGLYVSKDDKFVRLCDNNYGLIVQGKANIRELLTVNNNIQAMDLYCDTINSNVINNQGKSLLNDDVSMGNDVTVSGDGTFNGDVTVSGSTNVENLNVASGLSVSGGDLNVSNNSIIGGDCNITGNLSKGSGSFKIDHPLDPENKYLYHSFVESPEMMNVYRGNVRLDKNGNAIIKLPDYFDALNIDFSYQLTPIGLPAPNLYISEEISGNKFSISGGNPGQKVCWMVTGVRNDPYARENRIQVEVRKNKDEIGKLLHSESYKKIDK